MVRRYTGRLPSLYLRRQSSYAKTDAAMLEYSSFPGHAIEGSLQYRVRGHSNHFLQDTRRAIIFVSNAVVKKEVWY